MRSVERTGRQRGAILLLAMVFTTMLALLSASVLRVVAMELRMAGNEASRLSAFQFAEAIVSAILSREGFIKPGSGNNPGEIGKRLLSLPGIPGGRSGFGFPRKG